MIGNILVTSLNRSYYKLSQLQRCFLVVNENNNFLHARIHPLMVLIEPKIEDRSIELKAPNMDPIKLNFPSFSTEESVTVKYYFKYFKFIQCLI